MQNHVLDFKHIDTSVFQMCNNYVSKSNKNVENSCQRKKKLYITENYFY